MLVFSHAGEMTRSLVTMGDGMQVYNAEFFCLDAEQNLLTSDRGAHDVKIFSKDGTCLHTVGQEGHGRGMLVKPMGVALTKDLNLVIVSNNMNFHLQIFSCKYSGTSEIRTVPSKQCPDFRISSSIPCETGYT